MTEATKPTGSWSDAFPAPRTTAPIITREDAVSALSSPDLLVVDVRRTDYEGGTIKGSINLPAHSFYMNRAVLFDLCKRAGVKKVAFYCDYIVDQGDTDIESLTLGGGIKDWVKAGEPYIQHMEGFDAEYWKQFE
ncbi:hypothetical protein SNOG_04696 [Parastagonospora nodorum SN15]|uniref:Rhodanese domain-containing protein n=1 Tax=Phaeosphaeria nodorum (strain SN15 / ATCC MYA-4574 / FGSC 10173) TaxID=321614 RepID=Q0UU68_PHANO|nr:hypothetical protein SNOG_04696 [Parastagonospora nodorum SN15]EAT88456.2 hypothetical protein SNOG_04696 [Parastagonospora nodorum SN15]